MKKLKFLIVLLLISTQAVPQQVEIYEQNKQVIAPEPYQHSQVLQQRSRESKRPCKRS